MDAAERLARLEACEEIRRLIALYAQLLDSRRFAEWGALFTQDAVFRVWGRTWRGRAEIEREIGGMQRADTPGKHALLQPVIDLEGPDRARAWTDMAVLVQGPDGIAAATIGRYHDELVREDAGWRFAARTIVMAGEAEPEGVAPSPSR